MCPRCTLDAGIKTREVPDHEERKESRNRKTEQKGPKEFFGTNLPHLLRLTQVEEVVRLNAVWDELTTASN